MNQNLLEMEKSYAKIWDFPLLLIDYWNHLGLLLEPRLVFLLWPSPQGSGVVLRNQNGESERRQCQDVQKRNFETYHDISTVIVLWFENLEHLNHWFAARILRLMGSCLAVCNRPAMFNVKCIQLSTKLHPQDQEAGISSTLLVQHPSFASNHPNVDFGCFVTKE